MNPRSGSASLASMSWLTWRSVVKWCRARADMARPRPSMPGNRTATLPIGTSPPRFCSMLLSFILADARFFRIVEPTLDESVDLRGHFGFT